MQNRPFCQSCETTVAAINYIKENKVYYRSKCHQCLRLRRPHKKQIPRWIKSGYVKKSQCERCGFKSKSAMQLSVFYVDGNLTNTLPTNLKTICYNCLHDPKFKRLGWTQGDLIPDTFS